MKIIKINFIKKTICHNSFNFSIRKIGGNMKDIEVRVNKPYPKIVATSDDFSIVAVLKNLASSRTSEMSAVLQYIYQSVVADATNEEIADILEEIAIVEMTHLDMLMHAITDFGGRPKYEDSRGNTYTAQYINYTPKLSEMLDNNIVAEKKAIDDYKMAISKVNNESLKELFARIIEDEERHIEVFKYLRDSVQFLAI